jgi:uncharacterized RDD family membrane protein YckC
MTCPSCGGELVPGNERCPVCDATVAPRVEGALAPDPRMVTPPSRGRSRGGDERVEPLRDIPGLRKRERTWRDEVQDRVRSRRQKRAQAGLPLFDPPEAPRPGVRASTVEPAPAASHAAELEGQARPPAAPPPSEPGPVPSPVPVGEPDLRSTALTEAELADLPLQAHEPGGEEAQAGLPPTAPRRPVPSLDEELLLGDAEAGSEVDLSPVEAEPAPLERPARAGERAQAAAVDAAIFTSLGAVVVYFAGRAARADLVTLAASWPWLLGYLGLLALFYAGYFTGTTGQSPGKLVTGLRVVGPSGRPPGYLRAVVRAVAGLVGVAAVGVGVIPMAFDPAGRGLHDRIFRTRVVRR